MLQDQYTDVIKSGTTAATTANFDLNIKDGIKQGSIHIVTDSSFNGTTGTLALKGSNDGENFVTLYADDGTTPLSFTLAVSSQYVFELKRLLYTKYRLVYTKGDASAGSLKANFNGKQ